MADDGAAKGKTVSSASGCNRMGLFSIHPDVGKGAILNNLHTAK